MVPSFKCPVGVSYGLASKWHIRRISVGDDGKRGWGGVEQLSQIAIPLGTECRSVTPFSSTRANATCRRSLWRVLADHILVARCSSFSGRLISITWLLSGGNCRLLRVAASAQQHQPPQQQATQNSHSITNLNEGTKQPQNHLLSVLEHGAETHEPTRWLQCIDRPETVTGLIRPSLGQPHR